MKKRWKYVVFALCGFASGVVSDIIIRVLDGRLGKCYALTRTFFDLGLR